MQIYATTACWPGLGYSDAVRRLLAGTEEPLLGRLDTGQVQICPQNFGLFTQETVATLLALSPATRYRLHANTRVEGKTGHCDVADYTPATRADFQAMAGASAWLQAPAYSLHAGRRALCPHLRDLYARTLAIQALFDCPVAVEGLYPAPGDMWLISSWEEYRWLFESGLYYALDLSHLAIVARRTRQLDPGLVRDMLACERCLEVHLSDNDGYVDRHEVLRQEPWWWRHLEAVHAQAVIFSEGNQRRSP